MCQGLSLINLQSPKRTTMRWISCYIFILLVLSTSRVECLRLTKMSAPGVIDYRSPLQLECDFDMGGEQLYAVKWYKDDHEFFRFMPHQKPHQLLFPVHGVRLNNESIDCSTQRCRLTLDNLLRSHSSGAYRCEVSTEAPAFRLISATNNVTVAALPKEGPWFENVHDEYSEGEIFTGTCRSAPSDPPQMITWYINNELAPVNYIRALNLSKPDENGLSSSWMELRMVVQLQEFGVDIDLSCIASFDGVPESARTVSKPIVFHEKQIQHSNPSFTYWYSSATAARVNVLIVFATTCLTGFLLCTCSR